MSNGKGFSNECLLHAHGRSFTFAREKYMATQWYNTCAGIDYESRIDRIIFDIL